MQTRTIPSTVDRLARAFMGSTPTVGLSLGVFQAGHSHTFPYGETEKGSNRPPTADTLYAIASVTKTFTGTLLAQAVIEKRVTLDDDIRKYLDGAYPNLEHDGQPIRLIHLLNHNSGLPLSLPDARFDFYQALHQVELKDAPGIKLQYSNAAAQLMGFILERLYGKPYEELIKSKIAGPHRMRHTRITLSPSERAHFKGYDETGTVVSKDNDSLQAAGAIKSSVNDMLQYAAWHLADKDPAIRLTHQPHWKGNGSYALGLNWQMFLLPTYRVIWQEGSLPGFSSYCVLYPEWNLSLVALSNELDRVTSGQLTQLVKQITKELEPRATDLP